MARALRIDRKVKLAAAPEALWRAVSTARGLEDWFADRVSRDIESGELVEFTWGSGRTARKGRARVLRVDEGRSVMLRWEDRSAHSQDDYFALTLKKVRGGSELSVVDFATQGTKEEVEEIWDECLARLAEALK